MTTTQIAFPHPTLTLISGKPTPATLTVMKKELYANAMVQRSDRGGGQHGYLALVMNDQEYLSLLGTVLFTNPVPPGTQPDHAIGATGPQMTEANRRYDQSKEEFTQFQQTTRDALKVQILAAINSTYLQTLSHAVFGYANVTPQELMEHLTSTYGKRTIEDLEANRDKLKADWIPEDEIEHLWKRAVDCKTFAEHSDLALNDTAIMNLLLIPLEKSGVLTDDVKAWRLQDPAQQTWDTFKLHFERANKERNRALRTGTAGYNALNAALANVDMTPSANSATSIVGQPGGGAAQPAARVGDVLLYYCHSCGLGHFPAHTSMTCLYPKPGHKIEATISNMMGGSNIINPKRRGRTTPAGTGAGRGGRRPAASPAAGANPSLAPTA
jgi:hypothetical protein